MIWHLIGTGTLCSYTAPQGRLAGYCGHNRIVVCFRCNSCYAFFSGSNHATAQLENRNMVTCKMVFSDTTINRCEINRVAINIAPDYSLVAVCFCGETVARIYNYRGRRISTAQLYTRLYQDFPLSDFIHYANN